MAREGGESKAGVIMRRLLLLTLTIAIAWTSSESTTTAQAPSLPHTFFGAPTDFLLDGSEVTLPFLLIAQGAGGEELTSAVIDPCCQWALDVPVPSGVSTVVFVLSEQQDPSVVRGTSSGHPLEQAGTTELQRLEFQSGDRWTEVAAVSGAAGKGQLLPTPPVPSAARVQERIAGMSVANPDQLDVNKTVDPIDAPAVRATLDSPDVDILTTGTAGCGDRTVDLEPGFNAVGWTGGSSSLLDARTGFRDRSPAGDARLTTFRYDQGGQTFKSNDTRLPPSLRGFSDVQRADALWVNVESAEGATWTIPITEDVPRIVNLGREWNFAVWTGPDGTPPAIAFESLSEILTAAFRWDAIAKRMLSFRFDVPSFANTMGLIDYGTAIWMRLSAPGTWIVPSADLTCGAGATVSLPDFPEGTELIVQGGPTDELRAAAAADFTIFRNSEVLQGTNTSRIGEPIAANDRNAILYTGNWHAAVSLDNGVNWSFIDPDNNGFPAPAAGGAFCCDQLTWFDNDSGLLFWLLQLRRDGSGNNAVRLVVYQNKSDLADQSYCIYDYTPQTFGAPNSRWFDFNNMKTTDDWLYITSNRYLYTASSDSSTGEGGYVWRLEIADFSAACGGVSTQYYYNDEYYGIPLATEGSTAYWAVHEGSQNNSLEIGRATDGSTSISRFTRSISPFPTTNRGDAVCTAPDGTNPCARFGRRILTGWTSNDQLGFMWNAAQDTSAGWPMPHTRVAIFRTSDLTLLQQPHVWHGDYAWVMPTVGVNSRGDIAGPIYVMGGGNYPKAKAFIWDADSGSPAPWENRTLRTGNDAPDGKGTGEESVGRFGDYGGSIAYDNCRSTWLVAFYTMRDGGTDDDAEHRMAWIGRERDACTDLTVAALAFAVIADSSPIQILIAESTQNIGGGDAGASRTRYYLSRDRSQSNSDVLLDATHLVPALGPLESDGQLEIATVPQGTGPGEYYLIACADDFDVISEVTETNNCLTSDSQVTVTLSSIIVGPIIVPFIPGGP